MTEQLTANELAYDMGYNDSMKCYGKIPYEDWNHEGSYSSYKCGYEDAEYANEADYSDYDE